MCFVFRDFRVFFTHKQKKSSPSHYQAPGPIPSDVSPLSLYRLAVRSLIVTFIIMESYNPTASDTQESILMRRWGCPRGPSVMEASTGMTLQTGGRRRTRGGDECLTLGALPWSRAERQRHGQDRDGPCLVLMAAASNICFSGRSIRVLSTQRQMVNRGDAFCLWHMLGQKEPKGPWEERMIAGFLFYSLDRVSDSMAGPVNQASGHDECLSFQEEAGPPWLLLN